MTTLQPQPLTHDRVVSATGLLAAFNEVGVLDGADVHLAQTVTRLHRVTTGEVLLAFALANRAVRHGSSCVDLTTVQVTVAAELLDPALADTVDADWVQAVHALPWPDPQTWLELLQQSPLVTSAQAPVNSAPLRLAGSLLFLERHWTAEARSRSHLAARHLTTPPHHRDTVATVVGQLFDRKGLDDGEEDLQAKAVTVAAGSWTSVIAGGPGTGKTTTVARLLALLNHGQARQLHVALAAPSGKAAARLHSSVMDEWASPALTGWSMPRITAGLTVHRLLGARGRDGGFRKGPHDPLTYDVVVVDEVSMLDLFLFERLLSAMSPHSRLVLVGDPHQLSSVEAGRVLADITTMGLTISATDQTPAVVELQRNFRFSGTIRELAQAIVQGDQDRATALWDDSNDGTVELIDVDLTSTPLSTLQPMVDDIVGTGSRLLDRAAAGDAAGALSALDEHRVLCAHRQGAYGVARATREISELLRQRIGTSLSSDFAVGRPVLANTNQNEIRVFNGDVGVMVNTPVGVRLAMGQPTEPRLLAPSLVDGLHTLHAMTVHKAQGSQFDVVSVLLPPLGSPLLTRELVYTAVTRAKKKVRLIGSIEQLRAAIANPTQRLTGLGLTGLGLTGLGLTGLVTPQGAAPLRAPASPHDATS